MQLLTTLVAMYVTLWLPGLNNNTYCPPQRCLPAHSTQPILLAQKYGGDDPHGADPHGDDPHDDQHDPGLPANSEKKKYKAPNDVYGGQVPNDKSPYPPDLR